MEAAVLQSGILSDFFDIQQGCKQGDPISAYLFLLCAQVMFLLIMNEPTLKGIKINRTEFKITQFADDTTLILDGSKESLLAALNVLEIFGSVSGLINTDKTNLVWIGKKRYSKCELDVGRKLKSGATIFTLLGITFSVELDTMIELNYNPMIEQLEKFFYVTSEIFDTYRKGCCHQNSCLIKIESSFPCSTKPQERTLKHVLQIYLEWKT